MKSYLEMTLLVNAVILYVCFILASEMLRVKLKRKKCLMASFLVVCIAIAANHSVCFWIVYLLMTLYLFHHHISAAFESTFLYLVSVFLLQFFEGVHFSNGLIYTHASSASGLLICILYGLLDRTGKWMILLASRAELYVPALIQTAYETVECTGLIDTGNHALYQGLPVIFVRKQLICTDCIEVNSISGSCMVPAIKA